ncbi:MAG: RNA methyltransferase [Anaerolineaceae bacterium]|nr:RNA methyltransferase [Anaerolineaceae bacterium]
MIITSRQNESIKAIRSLHDSKGRQQSGLFLTEGLRAVIQALQSGSEVEKIVYNPDELVSSLGRETVKEAQSKGIDTLHVTADVLDSLARKEKPQGILAVVKQQWHTLPQTAQTAKGLWLGLEAIQNPGNLGTILRICDAVAAKGLLLFEESTDPYDPAAVKASMGSIFTVPVYKPSFEALETWIEQNQNLSVVGSSDRGAKDFALFEYPADCLILMGSERQGLSEKYLSLCSDVVAIPMQGACDSLNISVATGIIAYQAAIQHRTIS